MKLIKRTYLSTLLLSIPIVIIGSVFCYYIIRYINHEEVDEYLTYEMQRIQLYYAENEVLPEFANIEKVIPDLRYEKPFFKDTLLLETGDNELVPYRELYFSIRHKEQDYTIVLHDLLMGSDDIIEGTLFIIIGVILLTFLFQILMIQLVNKRIWKAFYETLFQLQNFKINKSVPQLANTQINEFNDLNNRLSELMEKVNRDYKSNKEFNENASHELQTHLAVIRAKTEALLNQSEKENKELQEIYTASTKLSQIQKSLLLLSKISNSEFADNKNVNFKEIIENCLDIYEDSCEIQKLKMNIHLQNTSVYMDKGLAEILANNLLKNAIKHNLKNGYITVKLSPGELIIENSGTPYKGDSGELFQRFAKGESGTTGIGLSIVKQICDIYHFRISYAISEQTQHQISIKF